MIDLAYAMGAGGAGGEGGGGGLMGFLPLVAIIVVFYFLLIRPQQKKSKEHQQLLGTLREGDKIVTSGGIYGTIVKVEENTFILEIADRVRIKILKGHVGNVVSQVNPNTAPTPPKE